MRGSRDKDFAAEMPAFLLGCQLILEMHPGSAGFDVRLHDLVRVQRSPETGFRICDDGRKPMALNAAIGMFDLVGTAKRPVNALAQLRSGIRGIQTLIRIHHACRVVVGGHLPA